MKRIHSVTTLAVAGAMSVGVAAVATTTAGATPSPRVAAAPLPSTNAEASKVEHVTSRTISDDVFSITRLVSSRPGSTRVSFCATDLRTGRTVRLN